jgi:hypothetical protein
LSSHSLLHTPHGYLGPVFLFFCPFLPLLVGQTLFGL